jgi:hypothetical protein
VAWCVVGGLCQQPVLNGSPDRCYYHRKLAEGYLSDSYRKWHATPKERPKMLVSDDGWAQADADVFEWLAALPSWGPI